MTQPRSSFSSKLPMLQTSWDSVSSGEAKKCWRRYQYAILDGWTTQEENVHLTFGILLHEARELYYRQRALGSDHEYALIATLQNVMTKTWDEKTNRPWAGEGAKNRFTLMRSIVWLLDELVDDPLVTLIDAQGRPMVEVSFRYGLDVSARETGEEYILCGHLDRVASYGADGPVWVNDTKTTKRSLAEESKQYFFFDFTPDNQVSLYSFASKVVLSLPAQGVIIDALQVAQTFTRLARAPVMRTNAQIDEWRRGFDTMLEDAERNALRDFWPMNEKSCYNCPFRRVCSVPPAEREGVLQRHYMKRPLWDPLQSRGE